MMMLADDVIMPIFFQIRHLLQKTFRLIYYMTVFHIKQFLTPTLTPDYDVIEPVLGVSDVIKFKANLFKVDIFLRILLEPFCRSSNFSRNNTIFTIFSDVNDVIIAPRVPGNVYN